MNQRCGRRLGCLLLALTMVGLTACRQPLDVIDWGSAKLARLEWLSIHSTGEADQLLATPRGHMNSGTDTPQLLKLPLRKSYRSTRVKPSFSASRTDGGLSASHSQPT